MGKIIKIEGDIISLGTDEGKIQEVRLADLNFIPKVGDKVDIFENEGNFIVTKVEETKPEYSNSGININLSNNQGLSESPVYVANNTKAVNKIVYCLLAFFLGSIGIHKFYAGKTSSGILYLLFCWTFIPSFISFIEFIVALCKKADVNGNILV